MGKKRYFWLSMGIGLLAVTSAAAQDEQWLQYQSSRDSWQVVGDLATSNPTVTAEKPRGVELPNFTCDEPLFARWPSPMAAGGGLWLAFDHESEHGPHDLLYMDLNGNGSLADEAALEAYERDERNAKFEPVKILLAGEDGPITYHLNVKLYIYGDRRYLNLWAAGWYEGTITLDGQRKHCTLIDYNANGTFDDKSLKPSDCDRIRIGEKDSRDTRFVGNYIEVDGVLYATEIAQDGAYTKLTKAEDVTFGNLRLPEAVTEFAAGGENGLFIRQPKNGVAKLPVGKYRVHHWEIDRKDEKGSAWVLRGYWSSQMGDFDVAQDKEAELSVGEPIISTLQARAEESTFYFSQNLQGRLGEQIELTREGVQPPPPKLNIKSQDGTYDRTFSFEYG